MLHINNTAPLITKPTRITNHTKTLIDHIYTDTYGAPKLKSIKMKQKMYRTHFYSNNKAKIKMYKSYSNELNKNILNN